MAKQTKQGIVVLDNTVLTNFGLVHRTELVTELWPAMVCSTPEVLSEYKAGVQTVGLPADAWDCVQVLTLTLSETALALSLANRLGAGERSCLAVAISRNGLIATDDDDARRYAKRAHVPVIGSIGLLIRNIQENRLLLSDGQSLLDAMIVAGYRSPVVRLEDLFH